MLSKYVSLGGEEKYLVLEKLTKICFGKEDILFDNRISSKERLNTPINDEIVKGKIILMPLTQRFGQKHSPKHERK